MECAYQYSVSWPCFVDKPADRATRDSDKRYHELRMIDVQKLQEIVMDVYQRWCNGVDVPSNFFQDEFFSESKPMIITCAYGQNQPICLPGQEIAERERWKKERRYSDMRYVSLAIASNHRSVVYKCYAPSLTYITTLKV